MTLVCPMGSFLAHPSLDCTQNVMKNKGRCRHFEDLHPADNLGGIQTAGEASELNRSLSAGHQIVDVEQFVSATGRLEGMSVSMFLHAPAVGTLLSPLGASDGVHSLFEIRGGVDEFGQFLCAPSFETDVNMDSAGVIHSMSFFVQDSDDLDELDDPGFALEDWADDFDSDMTGFVGVDAAIALGDPAFRQVRNLLAG